MVGPSSSLSLGGGLQAMNSIVPVNRGTMKAIKDDCSALGVDDVGLHGRNW